jgi:hypothetical protein
LVEDSGGARKPLIMQQARWSANMPVPMLSQYRSNLARLHAIALDVGRQDENVDIQLGARDFDAGLTGNHISHQFEEYDGTHMSKIGERLETKVFPFFSRALE